MPGLASVAVRLLARYGEPVVLDYFVGRTVDPATGQVINPGTAATVTAKGYPEHYTAREADGSSVLRSDTKLWLTATDPRPETGWRALVQGIKLRVMRVEPIRDADTDAALILQLRAQ